MQELLGAFAESLRTIFQRNVRGQAEEQLKRPAAVLLEGAGRQLGLEAATTPEIVANDGRPDIGVMVGQLLCGHVELKAPGEQLDPDRLRGRNKAQWQKFQSLPNLIYTNGQEWRFYRSGTLQMILRFDGDLLTEGFRAVSAANADRFTSMMTAFLNWHPIVPSRPRELARFLAPLARVLRDDVLAATRNRRSALTALRDEWRAYLFPEVTNPEFADAYAQTIVSAFLLARLEGCETLEAAEVERILQAENSLLGRIVRILTQVEVRNEISLGLSVIERSVLAIDPADLAAGSSDPWLYFYEDFLHAYDPKLAKDAGVYYTPGQIVRFQTRAVSRLLTHRFARPYSFAHEGVTTLDPAVGTGTYLVAAIQEAERVVRERAGEQMRARAEVLLNNLVGFELLVGPYAVAHLRLARELSSAAGGSMPANHHLRVYLADTLDSPNAPESGQLVPLSHRPLVEEREHARRVKADEPIMVCIGNPPYDRQMDVGADRKGGWVRFGDQHQGRPIFDDFIEPAQRADEGANIRSIYNDYVYFWRWALWKVFETRETQGPGIISFITGSSYLSGPGFVGVREEMRRCFDELWIVDLGGDNKGARKEPNVFSIQTPVAIAIGVRGNQPNPDTPAVVRYVRITGDRRAKLEALDAFSSLDEVNWRECPDGWGAPLKPSVTGSFAAWPRLIDLFPWQHNGAQFVRTWPIGPTEHVLSRRWASLLDSDETGRATAFRQTRDRTIDWTSDRVMLPGAAGPSIRQVAQHAPCPRAIRYSFRSFDRQWALYDGRLGDYLKPAVWAAHGPHQRYLTTSIAMPLGYGPAAIATNLMSDLHHYCGRGGKDLIPLYRDAAGTIPNVTQGLLPILSERIGRQVSADDLFAYVYGLLGGRSYTTRFWDELELDSPRIPITTRRELFDDVAQLGRELARVHTFGEMYPLPDAQASVVAGSARFEIEIPTTAEGYPESYQYEEATNRLYIGEGVIANVSPEVWAFEVSGLQVVSSWLAYRMLEPAGRRSSPLDHINVDRWTAAMSEELLEVLWSLERSIEADGRCARLLDEILDSPLLDAAQLPTPRAAERDEPTPPMRDRGLLL